MKKHCVIITSAINTKFGVYNAEQRMAQTLDTIGNVRSYIPGAVIFLLEVAGVPLSKNQKDTLISQVDHLIDFTNDPSVTGLYHSTDNWDVVKNVTEVMCFLKALETIKNSNTHTKVDRFFKVSGRYLINEDFNIKYYEDYKNQHCVVIGKSRSSQFPYQVTGIERQYMCRLWSWPSALLDEMITVYSNSLSYMYQRLANGGYADIEHCLYKFLDPAKVLEKETIGVSGNIAPNGAAIRD